MNYSEFIPSLSLILEYQYPPLLLGMLPEIGGKKEVTLW
jgi:hypothetical protein